MELDATWPIESIVPSVNVSSDVAQARTVVVGHSGRMAGFYIVGVHEHFWNCSYLWNDANSVFFRLTGNIVDFSITSSSIVMLVWQSFSSLETVDFRAAFSSLKLSFSHFSEPIIPCHALHHPATFLCSFKLDIFITCNRSQLITHGITVFWFSFNFRIVQSCIKPYFDFKTLSASAII